MDEQLLREFLAEAEELVEELFADIRALGERRGEGRARRELVGRIFRHVHTIKGSAAAAGLEKTGALAHEFESLLDAVRMGRVRVDDAVLETFGDAVQAVASNLEHIARGGAEETREGEAARRQELLVERLRGLADAGGGVGDGESAATQSRQQTVADATTRALESLPDELARVLSGSEAQRLREAAGEGASLFVVRASFDFVTFDEGFRSLSESLAEGGEIVSTVPGVDAGEPERVSFRIVYATHEERAAVESRVARFGGALEETGEKVLGAETAAQGATRDDSRNATGDGTQGQTDDDLGSASASSASAPGEILSSTLPMPLLVRVPLEEIDDLISAAHEIFTDTLTTLDLALSAHVAAPSSSSSGEPSRAARTELEIRTARIRRRFLELEEGMIELRMAPVGPTLERAARAGASAARLAGTEVDFETAGGEVRLDKSLAERIAEPLLHLLRNAVDHGVESSDERLAAGKSARGRVRVEAVSEGSRVLLRVADDGRGIDAGRVRQTAIERGLVEASAHVSEQQALRLIFRPGFSTAREVSSVSGRGVGLDVVEQSVEDAGGELRVRSRAGAGTTFEMRLPTTLALVPSLVVRSASHRYCVAASHVVEAGYLNLSDVESDGGMGAAASASWRGEIVPLVQMRALLGQEEVSWEALGQEAGGDKRLHVVISRVAGREEEEEDAGETDEGAAATATRAAVAVDGWEGHSEVLVRGLGRHATRWRGVSGATELLDGSVALMLDLPRLLEMSEAEAIADFGMRNAE